MSDIAVAILLTIGVPTALLIVRLLLYWVTGRLGNSQEQNTTTLPSSNRDTFTAPSTDVIKKEHQLYDKLNAKHRLTGEKCNDTLCGFPECERCAGYKTPYCRFYSKDTEKVAKQESDNKFDICVE